MSRRVGRAWTGCLAISAALARRHPLVGFFLLAYGFSWLDVVVLGILLRFPSGLVIGLTTLGPTVAAGS